MKASWILLGVLVGVPACGGKDEATTESGGATATTKTTDEKPMSEAKKSLVEAWKKAGLTPSEMTASTAFGKDCNAATVNKVEVVVCEFGSEDEAKKAEAPGLAWVGTTTGAAWTAGPLVIAVADRKKADANGKTINELMKSTPK